MSVSDIIPGFSGGVGLTISGKLHTVWNTWERIKDPKKKGDRAKGIMFYIIFVVGSLAGTFGFSQVIYILLENIPSYTFWFFIALSFSSIFIYYKFNKMKIDKRHNRLTKSRCFGFALGLLFIVGLCLVTYFLRGFQTTESLARANGEVNSMTIYILIYVAGFCASAAMVTPGFSGAIIILVLGVYGNIYGGLYSHPADHWLVLSLYFLFTLLGTITSIFVLDKLYKKYTDFMNFMFLGSITGSLVGMAFVFHQVLIPPDTLGPLYIVISVGIAFALAWAIIWSFNWRQKKESG